MKLRENENIPSADFFILENGNPIKKNTLEFFKDKKIVLFYKKILTATAGFFTCRGSLLCFFFGE